jgi:hypothetical protein
MSQKHVRHLIKALALLPYCYGDDFPTFFTWRAGLDTTLLDQMRAYIDKGMQPETFANHLLEFHTKK